MCLCAAADGSAVGDGGHTFGHHGDAPRHPFPIVRHHEVFRGETEHIFRGQVIFYVKINLWFTF